MSATVAVKLPEELTKLVDPSGAEVDTRVREAVVLYLFLRDVISSGKAAQLLGISKDDFRDFHQELGIPYFRQTIEEVLRDADVASRAIAERRSE